MEVRRCVVCGGTDLPRKTWEHETKIGGQAFRGKATGQKCQKCGEGYFNDADLQDMEAQLVEQLVLGGSAPTPAGFAFLMGKAGIDQKELATLLQVSAGTLSRRAHGTAPMDVSMWTTVGRIALERVHGRATTLALLRAMQGKQPKVVVMRQRSPLMHQAEASLEGVVVARDAVTPGRGEAFRKNFRKRARSGEIERAPRTREDSRRGHSRR
jgi:YgiT-type zinc finger domain-containing protein